MTGGPFILYYRKIDIRTFKHIKKMLDNNLTVIEEADSDQENSSKKKRDIKPVEDESFKTNFNNLNNQVVDMMKDLEDDDAEKTTSNLSSDDFKAGFKGLSKRRKKSSNSKGDKNTKIVNSLLQNSNNKALKDLFFDQSAESTAPFKSTKSEVLVK